jgi:hypothetical protein
MAEWKKSFRGLPVSVRASLPTISGANVKVLAGKRVTAEEIATGIYSHIGLTTQTLSAGSNWEVVPPSLIGTTSKRNSEGWSILRKDLPKYKKYFYRDIQNFGDGSKYGWSTVAIPRDIYETDSYPPYLFQIEVSIQEVLEDGRYGVVFAIDEIFF